VLPGALPLAVLHCIASAFPSTPLPWFGFGRMSRTASGLSQQTASASALLQCTARFCNTPLVYLGRKGTLSAALAAVQRHHTAS
jgi:hypothetical protein